VTHSQRKPFRLINSIRRLFQTETHGMKRKRAPGARAATRPATAFLASIYAGRVRWRPREQIGILRTQAGEVIDVSQNLMLAVTSGLASIPLWRPEAPPPEVVVTLTGSGEDALIEARLRAARKAQQRKAKR